jgi:hypothetical protein
MNSLALCGRANPIASVHKRSNSVGLAVELPNKLVPVGEVSRYYKLLRRARSQLLPRRPEERRASAERSDA